VKIPELVACGESCDQQLFRIPACGIATECGVGRTGYWRLLRRGGYFMPALVLTISRGTSASIAGPCHGYDVVVSFPYLFHRLKCFGCRVVHALSHCPLRVSSFTLVSTAIQFTSQVFPPSSENACSKRHESGVISDMMNRTRTARPLYVSWS